MSLKVLRSVNRASKFHTFKKSRRNFITLPGTEAQALSTTRILPYNSNSLYKIIADVDSYSTFIPYCVSSKTTKWSAPDSTKKCWPAEADLSVGWGGYKETFTSRLYCVPGSIVEALGGEAVTTIPHSQLVHYKETLGMEAKANNIFQSLRTRWTVKSFHYKPPSGHPQTDRAEHPAREQTEVHLVLDFQFSNPIYAALGKAVVPKIAGQMIEAFDFRARTLLDGPGANVVDVGMKEKKKAEAL